MKMQDVEIKVE